MLVIIQRAEVFLCTPREGDKYTMVLIGAETVARFEPTRRQPEREDWGQSELISLN